MPESVCCENSTCRKASGDRIGFVKKRPASGGVKHPSWNAGPNCPFPIAAMTISRPFSDSLFLMPTDSDLRFMRAAISLAVENVERGGGPFGALVVSDGEIIARGTNRVTASHDPTAHAEVVAIRSACDAVGHFELTGCTLYTSCEPCPMCMGAIYWSRLDRVVYAATRQEAAEAGFDDDHIYREIEKPPGKRTLPMQNLLADEARRPFDAWDAYENRTEY